MNSLSYKIKLSLSRHFIPVLFNLYNYSLSIKYVNMPVDFHGKIFVFWHSKMFTGWWIFRKKNFMALVSQSKDGEILSNILKKWNFKLARGSSSKGGKEALNQIIETAGNNDSVVMTPDGPGGPALEFKNGALIISKEKDIPIIPVKISYSKKHVFNKSWDKFEIPFPFSNCDIIFGKEFNYREFLPDNELINYKKNICSLM